MIQHQFGYTSIIFEKMYLGEFVDSKKCILNFGNTLSYYNADSIEDIESLLYEYFRAKNFNFDDLLSNKEIGAKNLRSQLTREIEEKIRSGTIDEDISRNNNGDSNWAIGGDFTPIVLPFPLPSILLDKGPLSGTVKEKTIKSLLLLEKKHIMKCLIRNINIEKNDVDSLFMIGPFMMALLDYIQFSTELIEELQLLDKEGKHADRYAHCELGDYIKEKRCIPIKESLSVFSYFKCVVFELFQDILLLFGDVINADGKRPSFFELYSMCFEHYPSKGEEDSFIRATLLYQTEKLIMLYDKERTMSLLAKLYVFYDKHRDDEQIRRGILRLENKAYWSHNQCLVEASALEDWDYINDYILKQKEDLTKKIECEVNPRCVLHILDKLHNQLQGIGFLHLPASKLVDIEFSIVRNLEYWLQGQYDLYSSRVSEYLLVMDSKQRNMTTEVKPASNTSEMKKTIKEMLRYMSGTNRKQDLIMTPSEYQYMLDCFYYFVDYGCAPKNMRAIDCQLNIGVVSYTFYILYKMIYPNDSSKRKAWLEFICALFRKLSSPEELYNNFSRKSDEFLRYYFSGDKSVLMDYIRNH